MPSKPAMPDPAPHFELESSVTTAGGGVGGVGTTGAVTVKESPAVNKPASVTVMVMVTAAGDSGSRRHQNRATCSAWN